MNIKSGIFTRGFAIRENTAFGDHSVKIPLFVFIREIKIILNRKRTFLFVSFMLKCGKNTYVSPSAVTKENVLFLVITLQFYGVQRIYLF